jgi:50S ribosomal protein L16 3-hydroxylase
MILDELLGPVPRAEFLERFYLRQPFARAGGCRRLVENVGWPLVEAVLASPGVDALAVRGAELWPGGAPKAEQARSLLADGYTIRVRHAERHDAGLTDLARAFTRAFGGAVDVHLYATPAGQQGLGLHYDAEEVFILQAAGSKEWSVRKNTVNPWPLAETIPADQRAEREVSPAQVCELRPGDWLYVPGGHWHRTRAGEESVSLSIGIMTATAVDVYDWLRRELLGDLRWRQRLPPPGEDAEELARRYREVLADLGRDLAERLAREETARAFLATGPRGDLVG